MRRDELVELHYITLISNVPSILRRGILSHTRAAQIEHESIAMQEIQDLRANIRVPGGRPLHEYANLYFDARNPMMYKRLASHESLCVLRIDPAVLELPGVIVTDGNAASERYTRYAAAPGGLRFVNQELTFAEDWTDPDPISYYRRKSAKCAEVLVPERVPRNLITGLYVSCDNSRQQCAELRIELDLSVNPRLFFR